MVCYFTIFFTFASIRLVVVVNDKVNAYITPINMYEVRTLRFSDIMKITIDAIASK